MAWKTHLAGCAVYSLFIGGAALSAPVLAQTVEQGRSIAASGSGAVLACATCHGQHGEGMAAAGFPYLAGQGSAYLAAQLAAFASGARTNPVMAPIAKAMNADQIKAVAAYYAGLEPVFDAKALSDHLDTQPPKTATGAWLANRGDWSHDIPACIQCHGPGGVGVGQDFPAIAGQSAAYIKEQLLAWKQKKRDPGPLGLMGEIAQRMDVAQITAVADYFAALPQSAKTAATPAQGAKR